MSGYFAELKNNIVQRVVSSETKEWCVDNLGGEWVETFNGIQGKNYAGTGYTYDIIRDNFISPQPYPSWLLDKNCRWQPPLLYPNDSRFYVWDEANLTWINK